MINIPSIKKIKEITDLAEDDINKIIPKSGASPEIRTNWTYTMPAGCNSSTSNSNVTACTSNTLFFAGTTTTTSSTFCGYVCTIYDYCTLVEPTTLPAFCFIGFSTSCA